jgi:hypothetical protein
VATAGKLPAHLAVASQAAQGRLKRVAVISHGQEHRGLVSAQGVGREGQGLAPRAHRRADDLFVPPERLAHERQGQATGGFYGGEGDLLVVLEARRRELHRLSVQRHGTEDNAGVVPVRCRGEPEANWRTAPAPVFAVDLRAG